METALQAPPLQSFKPVAINFFFRQLQENTYSGEAHLAAQSPLAASAFQNLHRTILGMPYGYTLAQLSHLCKLRSKAPSHFLVSAVLLNSISLCRFALLAFRAAPTLLVCSTSPVLQHSSSL